MRRIASALLLFTGAFAGGYVANRAVPLVHAQTLPPQTYQGTSFTLVDAQGNVQATLTSNAGGPELKFSDLLHNTRVTINDSGIVIKDRFGRTVWASPRVSGVMPAIE